MNKSNTNSWCVLFSLSPFPYQTCFNLLYLHCTYFSIFNSLYGRSPTFSTARIKLTINSDYIPVYLFILKFLFIIYINLPKAKGKHSERMFWSPVASSEWRKGRSFETYIDHRELGETRVLAKMSHHSQDCKWGHFVNKNQTIVYTFPPFAFICSL